MVKMNSLKDLATNLANRLKINLTESEFERRGKNQQYSLSYFIEEKKPYGILNIQYHYSDEDDDSKGITLHSRGQDLVMDYTDWRVDEFIERYASLQDNKAKGLESEVKRVFQKRALSWDSADNSKNSKTAINVSIEVTDQPYPEIEDVVYVLLRDF